MIRIHHIANHARLLTAISTALHRALKRWLGFTIADQVRLLTDISTALHRDLTALAGSSAKASVVRPTKIHAAAARSALYTNVAAVVVVVGVALPLGWACASSFAWAWGVRGEFARGVGVHGVF